MAPTPPQFEADLDCAIELARSLRFGISSIVFPRNQMSAPFLDVLRKRGITAYRGNADHWLYRDGHTPPAGLLGRALRLADSWIPISRAVPTPARVRSDLVNVQASAFLRPWSRRTAPFEGLKLARLRRAMTLAAQRGVDFHLWWHPHNFGIHTDRALAFLGEVLDHHQVLRQRYGVQSMTMAEVAALSTDRRAGEASLT